jgi:hypothetical protein
MGKRDGYSIKDSVGLELGISANYAAEPYRLAERLNFKVGLACKAGFYV